MRIAGVPTAVLLLAATILSLAGCGGRSPTAPDSSPDNSPDSSPDSSPHPLGSSLLLEGTASSVEPDGTAVTCRLSWILLLEGEPLVQPGLLEYRGTHGGDIQRTVVDTAGNGISLWPSVHGEVVVRSHASGRIEIVIPANHGVGARFWAELAHFEGRFLTEETARGFWNCAPFDIDEGGWVDTQYTARGEWTLRPE